MAMLKLEIDPQDNFGGTGAQTCATLLRGRVVPVQSGLVVNVVGVPADANCRHRDS